MNKEELKYIILKKFGTETACARKLGWPRQRLNKITNGKKIPNVAELNDLSTVLETSVEDLAYIFLPIKSPNGQHRGTMKTI
jgi:transcriptional regulator with XRE-family HTH domain